MKIDVTHYNIVHSKLPASFSGCRIALLADTHSTVFGPENIKLLSLLREEKPDYVLIAGDLTVRDTPEDYKIPMVLLKQLASRYLVYYTPGNHEYRLSRPENFFHSIRATGVHMLDNETDFLERDGDYVYLTGVNLPMTYYYKYGIRPMEENTMNDLVGKVEHNDFHILIAHNPNYFENYVAWGADLTVSGHNHGGLIRIPGVGGLVAAGMQVFPFYDYGVFHKGESAMVLSRGLGSHSIYHRVNNHPELVMIHLQKGQPSCRMKKNVTRSRKSL